MNSNAIQLVQDDHEIEPTGDVYLKSKNDGKIKIQIKKGSDAVFIEL